MPRANPAACAHPIGRMLAGALVLLALAAAELVGQAPPARTLALDEAIQLARRNNPGYLSAVNDQDAADWQVREAYAGFLPSVSAGAGVTYQEPGRQRIGAIDFGGASTDYLYSGYELALSWSLDGRSLFQVPAARAGREATAARIRAAEFNLESAVTIQYMATLRARDGVDVARRQLDRARENLELATVRAETGAVAMVDAKQAQVEHGRAEVALIQAERLHRAEKLRLMEQIGSEIEGDVELVTATVVFEPTWTRDELLARALDAHPSLRAYQAQEAAGRAQVRQARSAYFPSVSVSTGFRGNAVEALDKEFLVASAEAGMAGRRDECEFLNAVSAGLSSPLPGYPRSCSQYVLTEADRLALVSSSEVFPFEFEKNPLQLSLSVSVPIFNGLATQRQLEQARSDADDAVQNRRAEELRLRTAVTQAYDNLVTSHQLVELQERNREVAEEQLAMARQRYALGATSILELLDAQTSMQTAERDYLNSVYDFQLNLAALEAASGARLRPEA